MARLKRREKSYTSDIHANASTPCIVPFAKRIRFLGRASFRNDMGEEIKTFCHFERRKKSYTSDVHVDA